MALDLLGWIKSIGQVQRTRSSPAAKGVQARVGNYTAPVDTSGMDPEMMATMGIPRRLIVKQPQTVLNPSQRKQNTRQ